METDTPFSVVFLAGGIGTRMKSTIPKQYLTVCQKPLALYSFEILLSLSEVRDFIVVCESKYETLFLDLATSKERSLQFARPGSRRQDSVWNAIQYLEDNPLVCVHDSVRPMINKAIVRHVVKTAESWGAAATGVRVKSTIKICDGAQFILDTPNRESLWEIQTPQVVRLDLLREGFVYAQQQQLTVTDDVSLVELLSKPVKVVEGSYANIKVTTPEDLLLLEKLLQDVYIPVTG